MAKGEKWNIYTILCQSAQKSSSIFYIDKRYFQRVSKKLRYVKFPIKKIKDSFSNL